MMSSVDCQANAIVVVVRVDDDDDEIFVSTLSYGFHTSIVSTIQHSLHTQYVR